MVERADLIIVNETEYDLLPQLCDARLVADTVGAEAVMDPAAQPEFHRLEHYLRSTTSAETET